MTTSAADRGATETLRLIGALRVLPVVVVDGPDSAAPLGRALKAAGLPIAEVTFRTAGAERALAVLAEDGELLVGAGTILSAAQVDRAVDAGAAFVVSPGLDHRVVARAHRHGVAAIPGVATATEIQRAIGLGLSTVKLFPAGLLGGAAMVAALGAPFPGLSFIPTGGITFSDLAGYLRLPSVLAIGGSWMVAAPLIREARWGEITRLAGEARRAAIAVGPPTGVGAER